MTAIFQQLDDQCANPGARLFADTPAEFARYFFDHALADAVTPALCVALPAALRG